MNKNMAVGLVFSLARYGGVQTCVISLIKGLNEQGITPTLIWTDAPNEKIIEENNLKLHFEKIHFKFATRTIANSKNTLRYLLWPFNAIRASKLRNNYDFIYTFTHLFINDTNIPCAFYLSGPPYLPQLNPQQGIKKLRFGFTEMVYKVFLKPLFPIYEFRGTSENTVINAKFTSDLFFDAHGIRLDVVYPSNAFTLNLEKGFAHKEGVVFLSRIVPYKRPEMVIELAKHYPEIPFSIVGTVDPNQEAYYQSLKGIVAKYNLNNIRFVVNEKFEILQDALKKAKFYVFPTIDEHFGITTVEAIMSGTIPFVHNSGGQKEIVDLDNLRFEDNEFYEKFDSLINLDDESLCNIQEHFYEHAELFSENTFNNKMLKYIQ